LSHDQLHIHTGMTADNSVDLPARKRLSPQALLELSGGEIRFDREPVA